MTATMIVPMNGVVKYNQRSPVTPEITAGAKDLIGFIEAPETKPKTKCPMQ